MSRVPDDIRKRLLSREVSQREAAARALGSIPNHDSIQCLATLLTDESFEVLLAASRSLVAIGGPETVDALIPLLGSDDARLRNLVVDIIGRIGPVAVPRMTEALYDADKEMRKFAVDSLKGIKTPETEDPLIKALSDEDVNVAAAAAEALGAVGTQRSVPHLAACLDGHVWLRCAALKTLGEIGGENALCAVLSLDSQTDDMTLFCAITALERIRRVESLDFLFNLLDNSPAHLEPPLIQAVNRILQDAGDHYAEEAQRWLPATRVRAFLHNGNSDVIRSAISLLGLYRDADAVEDLTGLFREANQRLFQELEAALLRIRPKRSDLFVAILQDEMEPEAVKVLAVRLLAQLGDESALHALLPFLALGSTELRREIVIAIGSLSGSRAVPVLHEVLLQNDSGLKETAVEILERFMDQSSVPYLLGLAGESSASLRSVAATSLGKYDLTNSRDEIEALLGSPDPAKVAFALELFPETMAADFEANITALLQHGDETVRKAAVAATCRGGDRNAFDAVKISLRDQSPQVRLAAIRALEDFPREDAEALLLQSATSDPDEWNRYEAVKLVGRLGLVAAVPEILRMLDAAPDLVKVATLDMLGDLGDGQYAAYPERFARADDELVRDAAVEALRKLGL